MECCIMVKLNNQNEEGKYIVDMSINSAHFHIHKESYSMCNTILHLAAVYLRQLKL